MVLRAAAAPFYAAILTLGLLSTPAAAELKLPEKPTVTTSRQQLFALAAGRGQLIYFVDGLFVHGCDYRWRLRAGRRGKWKLDRAGTYFFCPKLQRSWPRHSARLGDEKHLRVRAFNRKQWAGALTRALRRARRSERAPKLHTFPVARGDETLTVRVARRVSRASSHSHELVVELLSGKRGAKRVLVRPLADTPLEARQPGLPRTLGLILAGRQQGYLLLDDRSGIEAQWVDLRRGFRPGGGSSRSSSTGGGQR
jgi:hypothetical protein